MSTGRGIIQPAHPVGRQVWITAIVALVLAAAVAIAISATRLDPGSIGLVPPQAQQIDATNGPGEGYHGPHGPNRTPKQMPTRNHDVRPHGLNRTPKG
jgi:hypothetical protein